MVMIPGDVKHYVKEHKGTCMINLFGSIVPIIMLLVYTATQIDSLASEKEVESLFEAHSKSEMHTGVSAKLVSIEKYLIAERIENLLKVKCTNPSAPVDGALRQLILDYDKISDTPYRRLSCLELGVI